MSAEPQVRVEPAEQALTTATVARLIEMAEQWREEQAREREAA